MYDINSRVTITKPGYSPGVIQGTVTEITHDFQGPLYAVMWDGSGIVEHYRRSMIEPECPEGGPHEWDVATGVCEKCFESKEEN